MILPPVKVTTGVSFWEVAQYIQQYQAAFKGGDSRSRALFMAAVFLNETPSDMESRRFYIQDGAAGEKGIGQVMSVWWQKYPENSPDVIPDQVRISAQVIGEKVAWLSKNGQNYDTRTEEGRRNIARMYNGGAGNFTSCIIGKSGKAVCEKIEDYADRLERNFLNRAPQVLESEKPPESGIQKTINKGLVALGLILSILLLRKI
jgi:hypothetical protein